MYLIPSPKDNRFCLSKNGCEDFVSGIAVECNECVRKLWSNWQGDYHKSNLALCENNEICAKLERE